MSTSETVDFEVDACPCGEGKIIKYVTTQDNPWSRAHISYGIGCPKCASEWRMEYHRSSGFVNRASEKPYLDASKEEEAASKALHELVDPVVDAYFASRLPRPMTHELREMQGLGISRLNIEQYRQERRRDRKHSELTFALKNLDWLAKLIAKDGNSERFDSLRTDYERTRTAASDARDRVVRFNHKT